MLLVPFVENAFKHGIGLTSDPFIRITLEARNGGLTFQVGNNYNKEHFSKDNSSGIGLANVKNRLALLYPGRHELKIEDSGTEFWVTLQLTLPC
jgi:sensor histidine kinase YesM